LQLCIWYVMSSAHIQIYCFPIYSESEYQRGLSAEESDTTGGFAIVINGHSLVHALHPQMEKLFLEVSSQCEYSSISYFHKHFCNNSLFLILYSLRLLAWSRNYIHREMNLEGGGLWILIIADLFDISSMYMILASLRSVWYEAQARTNLPLCITEFQNFVRCLL
jgi:hypothetical protein